MRHLLNQFQGNPAHVWVKPNVVFARRNHGCGYAFAMSQR